MKPIVAPSDDRGRLRLMAGAALLAPTLLPLMAGFFWPLLGRKALESGSVRFPR